MWFWKIQSSQCLGLDLSPLLDSCYLFKRQMGKHSWEQHVDINPLVLSRSLLLLRGLGLSHLKSGLLFATLRRFMPKTAGSDVDLLRFRFASKETRKFNISKRKWCNVNVRVDPVSPELSPFTQLAHKRMQSKVEIETTHLFHMEILWFQ